MVAMVGERGEIRDGKGSVWLWTWWTVRLSPGIAQRHLVEDR